MGHTMGRARVIESNWPGSVRYHHTSVEHPRGEREIIHYIARATARGEKMRAYGAGHSFSPIADTTGTLITLDNYRGLVHLDDTTGEATLRAGTRLWEIGPLLRSHGRALPVMGDIDQQAIAGAISTGTHGTGAQYTGFSALVTGLKIALASGDVLWCDRERNPRLFEAARLGLGALGIITEVRMATTEFYHLHRKEYSAPTDTSIAHFVEEGAHHDHRELFWSPGAKRAVVRELNHVSPATPRRMPHPVRRYVDSEFVGNTVFRALNYTVRKVPKLAPTGTTLISSLMPNTEAVGAPYEIFTEPRRVKFHETEMSIPAKKLPEVFEELSRALGALHTHVVFPLEIRRVKADQVWLSGAYDRDSVYIAAHLPLGERDLTFLRTVHDVLAAHEGRPHWGKMHWLSHDDLSRVYPMMDNFRSVRDEVDPTGMFMNEYVERCLEPATHS